MEFWGIGFLLTFLGGAGIALCNYLLSAKIIEKKPALFAFSSFFRQVLQVGYLLVVYFCAPLLPWDLIPLLLGAVLGITLSSAFLTYKLVKKTDSQSSQKPKGEE